MERVVPSAGMNTPRSIREAARFRPGGWRRPTRAVVRVAAECAAWFVLACVQIWGNPISIGDSIPRGDERSPTVPLLNVWTVGWNATQAASGFRDYWHAPIFYPEPGAFTFSEMQPTTLVVAPLVWSFGPVAAYNVYLAFQLALTAVLARRIVASLDHGRWLAILAGILFLQLPFVWAELGVLQLTAAWGPLAVIHATRLLSRGPAVTPAVLLGIAAAGCYAACNYYGLFLVILAPPFLILLWPNPTHEEPGPQPRRYAAFAHLPLAVVVATAAVSPLLVAQVRFLNATASPRPTEWVRSFSARPSDYLPSPPSWYRNSEAAREEPPSRSRTTPERPRSGPRPRSRDLGAGIAITTLALLGVLGVLLPGPRRTTRDGAEADRNRSVDRGRSRWIGFCATLAVVAAVASLGPRVSLFGFVPWDWLGDRFTPLGLIRTPFRFALFVQIAMTFLAIEGLGRVHAWFDPSNRQRRRWAAAGCLFASALAVISTWPAPRPLEDVRDLKSPTAWSTWLRHHTPPGSVVAGLPMPQSGTTADYAPTTRLMVRSLHFRRPIVNGYSGFFPPRYRQLRVAAREFPSPETIQELWLLGARYLVIDRSRFGAWGDGPTTWPRPPGISISVAYADPYEPVVVCQLSGRVVPDSDAAEDNFGG